MINMSDKYTELDYPPPKKKKCFSDNGFFIIVPYII